MTLPSQTQARPRHDCDDPPQPGRIISLFTPSWSFGALLFLCLFLPSFEGCNGKTVYPVLVFGGIEPKLESVLFVFLALWPYVLGGLVTATTFALLLRGEPNGARIMWWILVAGFVGLHTLPFSGLVILESLQGKVLGSSGNRQFLFYLGLSVAAAILTACTIRARNWFNAAMWLQVVLGLFAAITLWVITPALFLAERVLIGWKLAFCTALLLSMFGLVQRFDGQRALHRKQGDSPVQLTLKQTLVVMLIGGLVCAWMLAAISADAWIEFNRPDKQPLNQIKGAGSSSTISWIRPVMQSLQARRLPAI